MEQKIKKKLNFIQNFCSNQILESVWEQILANHLEKRPFHKWSLYQKIIKR